MERRRLNEARLRGNGEFHFSPLADADSPGHFLFRQQPWLQAHWRAWQEQTGSKLNRTEEEGEKRRGCGKMEEGEGRGVEARHEGCKASLVASVERGGMTEGQSMGRWKEAEDRASTELRIAEEARGSGNTSTAQPGRNSEKFRAMVDSQGFGQFPEKSSVASARKVRKSPPVPA